MYPTHNYISIFSIELMSAIFHDVFNRKTIRRAVFLLLFIPISLLFVDTPVLGFINGQNGSDGV